MFGQTGYAAARARYRDLDLTTKVEGASPHRLIGILFEELLKTLDTIKAGLSAAQFAGNAGVQSRRSRAVSILMGLEGSLDHSKGGELSQGLASVYREARRLVDEGVSKGDVESVAKAHEMLAEIAEAWGRIG